MDFSWLILIGGVIVAAAVVAAIQISTTNRKRQELSEQASIAPDFTPTQEIVGIDGESGIAVDENRKRVCLIQRRTGMEALQAAKSAKERGASPEEIKALVNTTNKPQRRSFSYRDLLSCEVNEDGVAVTKSSRTSQIGSALIGALAFGGVGAIVGSLTGKRITADKVTRIELVVVVNDVGAPIHRVCLLNLKSPKNGVLYRQATELASHWSAIIGILIRQADSEDLAVDGGSGANAFSVADEIKKLADLRDSGVLTGEEFAEQKKKLLNGTP